MSTDRIDVVVLHVAMDPLTGVWSVMRNLALAQAQSQRYAAVGIGVIHSSAWPAYYADELANLGLPSYTRRTSNLFGTAQFVWQRLQQPPISQWAADLMRAAGARRAIIHFHNAWMSGVFLPLPPPLNRTVKVVATMHGMFADLESKPIRLHLHRWMARRLIRHRAVLTSVDRVGTVQAENVLGIDRDQFAIVYNGVADKPAPSPSEWTGAGAFQLGYLGRLEERKGWEIGAQAAVELARQGKHVRYLIAGDGPQRDKTREWQRQHPDVIEYVGHVSDPRNHFLPKLHGLSLMSSDEGLPMSIIESISVGLPVIATKVGGVAEHLTDDVNALLIARDPASLTAAILKLYDQPNKHARLGCEGRNLFLKRFELNLILQEYHKVYLRCFRDEAFHAAPTAATADRRTATVR